jgi:heptosyltransferase-3
MKGRILVIRGGAIGDFILTLPALAALRQQFPDAHLEVLGYPHIAQLALAGGLVNRVQPIEARALAGFFARNGELSEDLRDYFSEFNIIVSYLFDPDEIFRTNVALASPAQFIVAPHRPDEKQGIHATQIYLKPLERLAIFGADPTPRLEIESARNSELETRNSSILALHPGSGSERKNWPEAKWSQLAAKLIAETKLDLLLVGGEAEGERLQRLHAKLPADRCHVAKSLSLSQLAARLRSCAGFVGHDSGITHLAAAIGLPCLVLWADTLEEIWRPQGERITLVKEISGITNLSVDRVVNELKQMLA